MSYYGMKGLGTYHVGATSRVPASYSGFGAVLSTGEVFDPDAIWSKWSAGGASANAAARLLQSALNELGASIAVDGVWGSGSQAAMKSIVGVAFVPGMSSGTAKSTFQAIADKLDAKSAKKSGSHSTTGGDTGKMSMASMGILAVGGLAVVAAAFAVIARKKGKRAPAAA